MADKYLWMDSQVRERFADITGSRRCSDRRNSPRSARVQQKERRAGDAERRGLFKLAGRD